MIPRIDLCNLKKEEKSNKIKKEEKSWKMSKNGK